MRIAEVDNQFFFNVGVGAVSIDASAPTPVAESTWGAIKSVYR